MITKRCMTTIFIIVALPALLTAEPQDLQVFTDFGHIPETYPEPIDFTIDSSPVTATFEGGIIDGEVGPWTHSVVNVWDIYNGQTATITFETPAAVVQFYGANRLI